MIGLSCNPGDGSLVCPGIDHMVAYWLGRYYEALPPPAGMPGACKRSPAEFPQDERAG